MSYQVLARKWRPHRFSEMVGQEHVLRALINALDNDRLHHAYLFTGTRGVGKTTIARILAKSLNCEQGVSSRPCGECSACREIDEGRFIDLIEVDAASRTKVDETRELLENVPYAPSRGRYKVYLIDEVHMFSKHSFNALLKTLEEPPPHVKFLLATTDPQKLPVTVLSRCLQFNLKRLPPQMIGEYLQQVLGAEQVAFDAPAVRHIARAADGSMRDALSLLDQAIAYGQGEVRDVQVEAMLGNLSQERLFELLEAVVEDDAPQLIARVAQLAEFAPDFEQVLADLVTLLHQLALAQQVPDAIDREAVDAERLLALAARCTPEDVQLWYQIGLVGRRDLPYAPDARDGFEMLLLRMVAFRPGDLPPATSATGGSAARRTSVASRAAPAASAPQHRPAPRAQQVSPPAVTQAPPPSAIEKPAATGESSSQSGKPELGRGPLARMLAEGSGQASSSTAASRQSPARRPAVPTAPPVERPPSVAKVAAGVASEAAARPRADEVPPPFEIDEPADALPPLDAYAEYAAADETPPAEPEAKQASPAIPSPPVVRSAHAAVLESREVAADSHPLDQLEWTEQGWLALVARLRSGGFEVQLANNCSLLARDGETLSLVLDAAHSRLLRRPSITALEEAITELLECPVTLKVTLAEAGEQSGETLAQARTRAANERQAAAEQAIADDPVVKTLAQRFGAVVRQGSIQPLDESTENDAPAAVR